MRHLMLSLMVFAFAFPACNTTTSNEPKLDLPDPTNPAADADDVKPAASMKSPADQPDADLKPKLKEMEQIKNSINVQGRTLSKSELAMTAMIENLLSRHDEWKKQWTNAQSSGATEIKQTAMDSLTAIRTDINDLFELMEEMEAN